MTLSELKSRVIALLSEADYSYWTEEQLTDWINEGQYQTAIKAKHLKETSYVSTTEDTYIYELPDDYIDHFRITYGTNDEEKLDEVEMGTEGCRGYWIWEDDINLAFNPDGENLNIYYFYYPSEMEDDTEVPEVPEEYQDILVNYTLFKAYQKEGATGDTGYFEVANYYENKFMAGIAEMQKRYRKNPSPKRWKVERI